MRTLIALVLAALLVAPAIPAAADQHIPICEIQGSGEVSPLVGQTVTTTGVVYATQLIGFWMQDEDCDDDPKTSDGIFVFRFGHGVSPGHALEVTGRVSEFFGATQVSAFSGGIAVVSTGNPLPTPTEIDPASARTVDLYYESLEHMRAHLAYGQTYVGTNRFGESFLVPLDEGETITERVRRTDEAPEIFAVDDGLGEDVFTFAFDQIRGVTGPLTFTFGNYKLYPEDASQVTVTGPATRPEAIISQPDGHLTFATWNLFNVFDELDPDDDLGVPAIPPEEQAVKRAKIARGIIDELGAPEVLAVQEVETLALLEAIAAETNTYASSQGVDVHYTAILEEGNDPRGIDVGFLVDTSTVEVLRVEQIDKPAVSDGRCEAGPDGTLVHDRVPLLIEVRAANGETFTAVSHHFKSKFGGTPENDFFEDCRVEQAESVRDFLRTENRGQQRVILLGDFNAFRDSPTLAVLTKGNFENVVDLIPEDRRFTFVFEGKVQFLDHAVVSDDLVRRVTAVDSSKLDNDVPYPIYEEDATTGWATSDHDPIVVHVELLPRSAG